MNDTKTLSEKAAEKHQGVFAGDFVLNTQKTHEAFTHVNKTWLQKCLTFGQAIKTAQDFQREHKDLEGITVGELVIRNGQVEIPGYGVVSLSDQAVSQLGLRSDVPATYLKKILPVDTELFDANVTKGLLRNEATEAETFLRVREKASGEKILRAILSDRYGVINNLPVIETLGDIIPGGRISHLNYDGDTFRANILVPDALRAESDSDYGGGISTLNNETGRFPYRSRPFVFRSICFNGNIWDREDGVEFSRRHLGKLDWNEFRKNAVLNIQRQIPLAVQHIDEVLALKKVPVSQVEIEQAIIYLGRREKLTQELARDWYEGFKVELAAAKSSKDILSAFGVVQGLTRTAQKDRTLEVQELLETLSAKLISKTNWDRTLSVARVEVSPEEAKEFFTVAK